MSFNKKKFVVYTKPPVLCKDPLSPKSYEENEGKIKKKKEWWIDAIFAKNYFVDPRYIIQHLIDHIIRFCKPLDRMKVTTMETIMKNSASLCFISLFDVNRSERRIISRWFERDFNRISTFISCFKSWSFIEYDKREREWF